MNHLNRAAHYRNYLPVFSWPEFPVSTSRDVVAFKKRNDISLNVDSYVQDEKWIYPILLAKEDIENPHGTFFKQTITFLGSPNFPVFCLLAILARLISALFSLSENINARKAILPESGAKNNYRVMYLEWEYHYFMVFEFEDILTHSANNSQLHIPSSVSTLPVRTADSKLMGQHSYRGEGCEENVIQTVQTIAEELESLLKQGTPVTVTDADKKVFYETTHSSECQEPFTKKYQT